MRMVRRLRARLLAIACPALLLACPAAAAPADRIGPEWVERWRSDLRFVADSLPPTHPRFFHTVSRERFRAALDSLSARVPDLGHAEIVVELARIVALVNDGHTRLTLPFDPAAGFFTGHSTTATPRIPGLLFRHLPVRLGSFSDGLWVVQADSAHRDLLGGRVVELGGLPIDAGVAAVEPTIQRDNAQQVRSLLPTWLVVPEILAARGVIDDAERTRLVVAARDGGRREAWLAPVAPGTRIEWIEARSGGEPPWMDRHPERRHWFATLPGTRTVYARYREVMDDSAETVDAFAAGLFDHLERSGAERLVLDLRGNVGGNGFLNRPLMLGIVRARRLWNPGALFVLIDRGTFSAAMMLAAELETWTPALFAGEKTGGDPNGYGDSRRRVLPETGLTVRVSTLYWQTTDPRDARDGIAPHLEAAARFEDWVAGRDPVLDQVLAPARPPATLAGSWAGHLTIDHSRLDFRLRLTHAADRWTARLDLPGQGVSDVALERVAIAGGAMTFEWESDDGPWRFRVRPAGDRLLGVVEYRGHALPMIGARAAAP